MGRVAGAVSFLGLGTAIHPGLTLPRLGEFACGRKGQMSQSEKYNCGKTDHRENSAEQTQEPLTTTAAKKGREGCGEEQLAGCDANRQLSKSRTTRSSNRS